MLTRERLLEVAQYDPNTGVFTCRKFGHPLGRRCHAYVRLYIDSVDYAAHHLVWLYVHGYLPGTLDHINGVGTDNRIENLRITNSTENAQNQKGPKANNKVGLLGVVAFRGKFRASIRVSGRNLHLGTFETKEKAHEAYLNAKRRLHAANTL